MIKTLKKYIAHILCVTSILIFPGYVVHARATSSSFNTHQGLYVSGLVGTTISGGGLFDQYNTGFNGYAWDVSAGYLFDTNWGIETGFMRQKLYGTVTVTNQSFQSQAVDVDNDLTVTYLAARFDMPIRKRFTLISKLGIMHLNEPNITATADIDGIPSSSIISNDTSTFPFIGLGLSYSVSPTLALLLQWQGPTGTESYGFVGLGLEYYFM